MTVKGNYTETIEGNKYSTVGGNCIVETGNGSFVVNSGKDAVMKTKANSDIFLSGTAPSIKTELW